MRAADTQPPVLAERHGAVQVITFNRPERSNCVTKDLWSAAGRALEAAAQDQNVRVVVLTGAGDRAFCAGADLKAVARGDSIMPDDPQEVAWGFAGITNHPISKPLIVALNGAALGAGADVVVSSDIVIAADNASIGFPGVRLGLLQGAGAAFRVMKQVPRRLAMELLLTGDTVDAQRAQELGLVNRVVPRERLMEETMALAQRIAANAPLSVQATKRIALGMMDGEILDEERGWTISRLEIEQLLKSEDSREGARAFTEKRDPVWKGR